MTRDKCSSCGERVRWARTAATGSAIPLDPDPVDPQKRGALVLIGERAFGLAQAAQRLAVMFDESEADAAIRANNEYGWHISHFATCSNPPQNRNRRRRRT